VSVRLKIEDGHEGFVATLSQRDDKGKVVGRPSVFPVGSKAEAKRQAKTLARSLGLKVYGLVDKTAVGGAPRATTLAIRDHLADVALQYEKLAEGAEAGYRDPP
jgi:hypothetical protein